MMGIVGLPNVGKSSLFNALTQGDALIENRPFSTIDPNIGVVKLMDERLYLIADCIKPQKTTPSFVKFLDIAGLVKGAYKGEGLGNKFLENIRSVDAICLVVRAFNDSEIFSVLENKKADPVFEAEIILCELIYSDLEMVNNVLKKLKSNDPKIEVLSRLKKHLEDNNLVFNFSFTDEEKQVLKIYSFLTDKSIILLANTDDSAESKHLVEEARNYAKSIGASFLDMNIKFEQELSLLNEADREEFLESTGKRDSCLNLLVKESFFKLGLKVFFTAGVTEVKSWMCRINLNAAQCAGLIHSDIEKGFIKAKVIKYGDFEVYKNFADIKKLGKIHYEGRNYIVEDGDIINFEFRS